MEKVESSDVFAKPPEIYRLEILADRPTIKYRKESVAARMPLHLIKLAVGVETLSDLAARQQERLAERVERKEAPELIHITRHRPKRSVELLNGGSIYWVVKGFITARQRLIDFRGVTRDGVPHCALVFDAELVPVALRPQRAFQGWRHLEAKSAPPDHAKRGADAELPEELKRELVSLGLL